MVKAGVTLKSILPNAERNVSKQSEEHGMWPFRCKSPREKELHKHFLEAEAGLIRSSSCCFFHHV